MYIYQQQLMCQYSFFLPQFSQRPDNFSLSKILYTLLKLLPVFWERIYLFLERFAELVCFVLSRHGKKSVNISSNQVFPCVYLE